MKSLLRLHGDSRFGGGTGLLLALAAGTLVLLSAWHRDVQGRVGALSVELRQLEAQWNVASASLAEAREARKRFDAFSHQAATVTAECDRSALSSALQAIVACTKEGIQLRGIRVRQAADRDEEWSLRIAGISAGGQPRAHADGFRQALDRELEKAFHAIVTTQFEQLEDLEKTVNLAGEPPLAFTIVVRVGTTEGSAGTAAGGS